MDFKLDDLGRVTDVSLDAQVHEEHAVNSAIETAIGAGASRATRGGATARADAHKGPTVADAIATYFKDGGLRPKTARRYEAALRRFEGHFRGDTSLYVITQARFAEFAKVVKAEAVSVATRNFNLTAAGTMLRWSRSQLDDLPEIRTEKLKLVRQTPESQERSAFTLEELRILIAPVAPLKESEPGKYWATVVCAFSGVRIEELCQIDIEKGIAKDNAADYWHLDINGHGGRNVKTRAGWRKVPLHPAVVNAGFIEYVESLRASGEQRLFPQWPPRIDPKHGGATYGHAAVNGAVAS